MMNEEQIEILNQENQEVAVEQNEENIQNIEEQTKQDAEIVKLKAELEESKDKYLRLFAEFDNFKKRTMKERLELIKTASQETMAAMLPVVDDFERAKKASELENATETFSEGVNLVFHKFMNTLESRGLKAMESNGEAFDAEKHEAITEIPAPSPELSGKVIDTVEKGFYLNDKIIRYAKVVVGK